MPVTLDPGEGSPLDLDGLVEAIDASGFDPRDEASLAALAPLLARLGRNRAFLSDLAIDELKSRFARQDAISGYGAQALVLAPPRASYALRAAFWPARDDAVVRASGTAAFFYDMAHDHNFSFLTLGYLGPGYLSDHWEVDHLDDALPGDPAPLVPRGRDRLAPGTLALYRAHRDVHAQLPPDAFSVSLNILAIDPGQAWRNQYRFDIARQEVAEVLTVAPAEALAALAAQFGGGNGLDLVHDLAGRHPSARMRRTALDALAGARPDRREALYLAATADPGVARHARARLNSLRNGR